MPRTFAGLLFFYFWRAEDCRIACMSQSKIPKIHACIFGVFNVYFVTFL